MDTDTMLILDSLKDAGFGAIYNLAGNVRVYLSNRPVSTLEVTTALRDNGFSSGQFRTYRSYDNVVVIAR